MRLYPPIAAITRAAVRADVLGGVEIQPGTMIVIAPYVLHRHRKLWNAPEMFDPSRFLGSRKEQIERFAYLPFGFGPRMCIGHAFALQEAVLAVSTLVREFVLRPNPDGRVWPVLKITLRPEHGLPMYLARREQAAVPCAAEPGFAGSEGRCPETLPAVYAASVSPRFFSRASTLGSRPRNFV
jgi:cytochrome P450